MTLTFEQACNYVTAVATVVTNLGMYSLTPLDEYFGNSGVGQNSVMAQN